MKLQTNLAPKAIGPYAQAILSGDFIFVSGQLGMEPENGTLLGGVANQARQALENLSSILQGAGSSLNKVVKVTVFLQNMDDFGTVNEIYAAYFKEHTPARSCVAVAALPKGGLVEIEAIAEK